jgi:hypothetical protein
VVRVIALARQLQRVVFNRKSIKKAFIARMNIELIVRRKTLLSMTLISLAIALAFASGYGLFGQSRDYISYESFYDSVQPSNPTAFTRFEPGFVLSAFFAKFFLFQDLPAYLFMILSLSLLLKTQVFKKNTAPNSDDDVLSGELVPSARVYSGPAGNRHLANFLAFRDIPVFAQRFKELGLVFMTLIAFDYKINRGTSPQAIVAVGLSIWLIYSAISQGIIFKDLL